MVLALAPAPPPPLLLLLLPLLLAALPLTPARAASPPNIVVIVADDLGFNDVSFHGADQIPTPNLDALAFSGMILNRHYVQPVCTPTRAALMTAKYPIRMGLQGSPLRPGELRGLPPGKLLPEYLREQGYATHAVGKWHLGYYEANMTPTYRGFDSHLGFWNGLISYYDHVMGVTDTPAMPRGMYGYDLRMNMSTAWELSGRYITDVFTQRAEQVIDEHDSARPLFLYVAHGAVHAGNDGQLLEASRRVVDTLGYIDDPNRRMYAAMVKSMDDSIGRVVEALEHKGILDNTLILFTADNGAPTYGIYQNWGSNYPLRGIKDTFWDGGVRSAAALWGTMLGKKGVVSNDMMHITDWLPTFHAAAGGDPNDLVQPMDGVNQWEWLTGSEASSQRNDTLINIDEERNASAFLQGRWKLVQGVKSSEYNAHYGDSGVQARAPPLNAGRVWGSRAGRAVVRALGRHSLPGPRQMAQIRAAATIKCNALETTCNITGPDQYCLFDMINDPCEKTNLANEYPQVAQELLGRIMQYGAVLEPQTDSQLDLANADPLHWGRTWTPWVTCARSPEAWCNASPAALAG